MMAKRDIDYDQMDNSGSGNEQQDSLARYRQQSDSENSQSEQQQDLKKSRNEIQRKIKRQTSRSSYRSKIEQLKKHEVKEGSQEEPKPETKEEVLKRNRQSAKECRERKKIYISLLQKKVQDLQKDIQQSKEKLKNDYRYACQLIAEADSEKMKYLTTKLQLQKRMSEELNKTPLHPNSQMVMEMFLLKFDSNGKLQNQLRDSQFDNIVRLLLDHKFYTFWEQTIMASYTNFLDVISVEGPSPLQKISSQTAQRRTQIFNLLTTIKRIKQQIKDSSARIQYLSEQLASNVGLQQIVKFLVNTAYIQPVQKPSQIIKQQSGSSVQETIRKKQKH